MSWHRRYLIGLIEWYGQRAQAIQRLSWWGALALIVVLRMWLTAYDEIVPIRADSTNYARESIDYLDATGSRLLPSQSPGLPILAIAGRSLGIPFKLWLDGWFIAVSLLVAHSVWRLAHSRVIGLGVFATLLLNPWFMNNTTLFMSEALTGVLVLAMACTAGHLVAMPARRWSAIWVVMAGMSTGLYVLTRPEWPVAAGFWALVMAIVGLRHWRIAVAFGRWRRNWRLLMLPVPLVITILGVWFVQRLHAHAYGVAALSVQGAPGMRALLDALYSIPPEESIRFAPVTYQSLAAACDVSPTLANYRGRLLDRNAFPYRSSERELGLEGEFGTWLNWLLVGAFGGVHYESDRAMQQCAAEISAAQQAGQLGVRKASFPVDPLWREWFPAIPSKLWSMFQHAVTPSFTNLTSLDQTANRSPDNEVDLNYFNHGLLRRDGTKPEVSAFVLGVLNQPTSRFARAEFLLRGAVEFSVPIESRSEQQCQFRLIIPGNELRGPFENYRLRLVSDDTAVPPSSVHGVKHSWRESRIGFGSDGTDRELWMISAARPTIDVRKLQQRRVDFAAIWSVLHLAVVSSCLLFGLGRRQSRRCFCALSWLLLMSIGFLVGRIFMAAMIEVWLGWIARRYAETNHLLSLLICCMLALWLGAVIRWCLTGRWGKNKMAAAARRMVPV